MNDLGELRLPFLVLMALQDFQLVKRFISTDEASSLEQEFLRELPAIGWRGDPSCPNSPAAYNFRPFVRLMCAKLTAVEQVSGLRLLPTYTYARHYQHYEQLKKHTDRPACEISVTLNLSSDREWPIFMERDGKPVPVTMGPGDAVIYRGMDVPHWRDFFEGYSCAQVFMHYVDMDGPHADLFFERQTG